MVRILLFLPLVLVLCCSRPQTRKNTLASPFEATWRIGDEDVITHRLRVYTKDNQVWADKLLPYFYYGRQTDSLWQVQLSPEQIRLCNAFLKKARSLPPKCDGYPVEITKVVTPVDTLTIAGDCRWGKLGYYDLERQLFEKEFEELKKKREALEQQLTSTLNGRWYLTVVSDSADTRFILRKTPSATNKDCYWDFSSDYQYKSGCTTVLPMPFSRKYELDIDEGKIYLLIIAGGTLTKDLQVINEGPGADFVVESYTDTQIILLY